ncbi:right-handed parallel beta-helix repeat-containing protein [Mucilaginibacter daejeonensis]|uniref:right-handed parallel beta-helix repeat-containing protein n=1 Tax=Mucilaginibacter daejeonensis TaxID=398049 RepID=UPI001D178947|nr:right-handed parallel beta-helix repeat-containing protein [Mucilaginibacter daejeonensis]UEG52180.1 right-handed parallel beta-helix repeat-containing protein [Mucilaginibacter daejeonensis]
MQSTSAKSIYVSSSNGNDKYDGSSTGRAKKTLQKAADMTSPGDTVFVMQGTYTNDCSVCNVVNITRSGKKDRYITYINYPGQHPVIRFNGWAGISLTKGVSYVRVEGMEVVGYNAKLTLANALKQPQSCANKKGEIDPRYNGNGIVIESYKRKRSHHIAIVRNTVHDCGGGGIGASQCDYINVEENVVYNNSLYSLFGTSGIAFYQFYNYDTAPGYHNVIRRNKCYNNRSLVPWIKMCKIYDGNGIIIDDFRNKQNGSKQGDYKSRTLIENNICWFNGGTGIHAFQSDHVDIINNTAYCNSRSPEFNPGQILTGVSNDVRIVNNILVADNASVINSNYQNTRLIYENNLHYNVTDPSKAVINVTSGSCINGKDPGFVNASNSLNANFDIKKSSPCVGKGHPRMYSTTDFTGAERSKTSTASIGAFEP